MCIYCNTNNYRKIYENHIGPIPKEENGRTYEIHHVDGNRKNNDPTNLKCVSIQEHYSIHYSQGDWAACLLIANRINLTYKERCEIAKLAAKTRTENGTHPSSKRTSEDFTPEWRARIAESKKGKSSWNKGIYRTDQEKQAMREGHASRRKNDPTAYSQPPCSPKTAQKIREANTGKKWVHDDKNTRRYVSPEQFIILINQGWKAGLGNRKAAPKTECSHCGMTIDAGNYARAHGDKCKHKK